MCRVRNSKLLLRLRLEHPIIPRVSPPSGRVYFHGKVLFLFINFQMDSFSVFHPLPSINPENAEGMRDMKHTEFVRQLL